MGNRTKEDALANKRIQRSELEKQAMETVINALVK